MHKQSPAVEKENDIRWGMVIDTDCCTGCKACEVACAAENNLPTAGPEGVAQGREFKWIRIERYWEGEYPNVRARFMPVLCQQCDSAPCEPVCPVFATYHNDEGLNVQVYNRCVGTRYCANNCPYKVRSFNWFQPDWPESLIEQLNPDVSVRDKGVMEKCTFCVQRIRRAKDSAAGEGRPLEDGDVVPACAQVCPTEAIIFGNIADPDSRVVRAARDDRAFHLLEELGTQPSVVYLRSAQLEDQPDD